MNLTIIAAIVAAAVGFGAGYRIEHNANAAKELVAANAAKEKYDALELQFNTASGQLEAVLAAHRASAEETTRTINKIVDRPVYRRDCLDADGLRAANDALTGAASPAKPASAVSRTPTP